MSAQWSPQHQQVQQYQQAPHHQQPPQYQHPQQYQQPQQPQTHQYPIQQPQYRQTHQYPVQNPQIPPQQYQQPPQQYSQPPPYAQQGHYTHGQQYAQAGQYTQAQPYQQQPQQYLQTQQQPQQYPQTQQQPQQYPQTQQQGYNGYQQQHPPQQYYPQEYSSQQQGTPQYVSHQQQVSPTNPQLPNFATSKSCYNCGNPNHFAQNCPQPKHAVPAGALAPRKFSNPLKHLKPGVNVVSQSSPPPASAVQSKGYPQGYPPSTYNQNGYSEHQAHCSPATPTSAQSSAQQEAWQQYWQWQAYQHQHQHQQGQQPSQQQGVPYAQQTSALPVNQAVGYKHNYQQPSQAHFQASQYGPDSQIYQPQFPQAQSTQTPTVTATLAHHHLQPSTMTSEDMAAPQRQLSASSISMESQATLANPSRHEDATEDLEELDLGSLDVPDLPKDLSQNGENIHLSNTIVSPPVSLIGMPLPANFVVADALYPIEPPAPEAEGRCQSKYLRDMTSEVVCENIKVSKYWKDHKDDTVFFDRPNDDNVVSVDEIRAQLKERHTNGEANDDLTRQTRSESRSSIALRKDSADARTRLEQLELEKAETLAKIAAKERQRALRRGEQVSPPPSAAGVSPSDGQTIVKEEQVTPISSAMSEKAVTYQQSTEEVLASLGVTGSPKPVTAANGAYDGFMHDHGTGARAGPIRRHSDLQNSGTMSYSPDFGPPPPPPPPLWQASFPSGADGSPYSAVPGSVNGHAFGTNGIEPGNGYFNNGTDEEVLSPNGTPYDQSSIRKRSYNRRDSSSSEEDTPARRQEDDVTPKLKRHQPKVAAAYSRRW